MKRENFPGNSTLSPQPTNGSPHAFAWTMSLIADENPGKALRLFIQAEEKHFHSCGTQLEIDALVDNLRQKYTDKHGTIEDSLDKDIRQATLRAYGFGANALLERYEKSIKEGTSKAWPTEEWIRRRRDLQTQFALAGTNSDTIQQRIDDWFIKANHRSADLILQVLETTTFQPSPEVGSLFLERRYPEGKLIQQFVLQQGQWQKQETPSAWGQESIQADIIRQSTAGGRIIDQTMTDRIEAAIKRVQKIGAAINANRDQAMLDQTATKAEPKPALPSGKPQTPVKGQPDKQSWFARLIPQPR